VSIVNHEDGALLKLLFVIAEPVRVFLQGPLSERNNMSVQLNVSDMVEK
jgi:hypothetical protein